MWLRMLDFGKHVFTKTNEEGIERVRNGYFAFVIPDKIGEYIAYKKPCDLMTVDHFLMKHDYAFAVQKGSPLLQYLNRGIKILRAQGVLDELYARWWVDKSECNGIRTEKIFSKRNSHSSAIDYNLIIYMFTLLITILLL